MVAQGGVIVGLCGVGVYTLLTEKRSSSKSVVDHNKFKETIVHPKKASAPSPTVTGTSKCGWVGVWIGV